MSTPDSTTATLIQRLDAADLLPGAADLRTLSYDLLHLHPGDPVVDVGCGSGRAVAELAARETCPIGIDPSETMLDAARTRWTALDFRHATAESLPLPDGSMTGYRADKVFHELACPTAALAEARRVLVPGGRIVLLGQDWDAIIIDSDSPETTRAIVHARAATIPNPRAARQYRTLLLDNDFHDVSIEARTAVFTDLPMLSLLTGFADAAVTTGAISTAAAAAWITEQSERAESERLFLAFPIFIAAATRP
ncbi:methyltransferase domain-containing protein [Nocardia sp. KC 131]|uniref:methyltransferase domain-containing protein n=1 Tax=Nocardia arseniciresistens TaxID=3392119 RepID=UPI00398EF743